MANNFQQWNPNGNNMESDATYTADSQRTSGATSGQVFLSALANKLFYQNTIMTAALAGMLADKGFNPNDGSASPLTALANLKAVLANILTTADNVPIWVVRNSLGAQNTNLVNQLLYAVPAGGVSQIFRLSWSARFANVAGGAGNIIGPMTLNWTDNDNTAQSNILMGFSKNGVAETSDNGNTTASRLNGTSFIFGAKPGTNIRFNFGYQWSGAGAQLLYILYLALELVAKS